MSAASESEDISASQISPRSSPDLRASRRVYVFTGLTILYLLVHVYVISFAICPTRDGARFLAFADRLESESWLEVLPSREEHPAYPVLLYISGGVAKTMGGHRLLTGGHAEDGNSHGSESIGLLDLHCVVPVRFQAGPRMPTISGAWANLKVW